VERLAVVVGLRPGAEARAAELIAGGPPFDPEQSGFVRHSIYVGAGNVVFVFEGHEVEWLIDSLVDDPFHWMPARRWRNGLRCSRTAADRIREVLLGEPSGAGSD
jgi:hypothetical protein